MPKSDQRILVRIVLSALLLIALVLAPLTGMARLFLFFIPYLLIGGDILFRAGRNILHGQIFDENFLMALATIGAFCIGDYPEGVFVMLFYQVGELFQRRAVEKSRASISSLMDLIPEFANVDQDGVLLQVDPAAVEVGQIIVVKPGEKIPLDGLILEGSSSLNTMALTGESLPRDVEVNDEAVSGCVNLTGLLRLRVTRCFEDSAVSKILELVETASSSKAKSEAFITRFSKYYTPAVVIAAAALALIPSLLWGNPAQWVERALSFLVISCPCALVLSVPLAFFAGIGGASRRGILVKGATYLEALSKAKLVAFDKTGTLTSGHFSVAEVCPYGTWTQERLLRLAARAELYSDHPIAVSLREALPEPPSAEGISDFAVLPGYGVSLNIDGLPVYAGNAKLMAMLGIQDFPTVEAGSVVYLSVDGQYIGCILLADQAKESAKRTISGLHKLGIRSVMLTGDRSSVAKKLAEELTIDEVHAELLPQDKVSCLENLMPQLPPDATLVFVGDGINDAPVLARADVGVSMGAFGSDAALEAADIVLMDDDPETLLHALQIAKKTMRISKQNIVFSLGVKALVLLFSILGFAGMWQAVLADVGVSVLAILNATRNLRHS